MAGSPVDGVVATAATPAAHATGTELLFKDVASLGVEIVLVQGSELSLNAAPVFCELESGTSKMKLRDYGS